MSTYALSPISEFVGGDYRVSCKALLDILEKRATILAIETSTIGLDEEKTNVIRGQRYEVLLLADDIKQILYPRQQ